MAYFNAFIHVFGNFTCFWLVKLNTKPFSQNLFVFFVFEHWFAELPTKQTLFH